MPIMVAFLDVLGFSPYTEEDISGAQLILRHQQWILDQKLTDGTQHPASSYCDPDLARVAESHLIDSFTHFLPFSDSTFIVSNEPDKFVRQLSNFLIECIGLVGHVYSDGLNPQRPENVTITSYPSKTTHQENWYPPLWRGGIATGTLEIFNAPALENGQRLSIPNLAGTAVVKAVRLERSARGPRLFCETGFAQHFGAQMQPFFHPINSKVSELLWPAFVYLDGKNPHVEMNEFHTLWQPALHLWKSKRSHASFEHYDEFLRLLVRSFTAWADTAGCGNQARERLKVRIREDLAEDLVDNYLT